MTPVIDKVDGCDTVAMTFTPSKEDEVEVEAVLAIEGRRINYQAAAVNKTECLSYKGACENA